MLRLALTMTSFALMGLTMHGCGTDSDGSDGGSDGTAVPDAGPEEDVSAHNADISCANACARAPKCEAALVTEADCNALCEQDESPEDYACCLQYASGCAEVKSCLDGSDRTCEPEGDPWIPIAMFAPCPCAAEDDNDPKAQCIETGPDVPCPGAASCFKPANSTNQAFCAVDCTNNPGICPENTTCEKTPKNWYCRKI